MHSKHKVVMEVRLVLHLHTTSIYILGGGKAFRTRNAEEVPTVPTVRFFNGIKHISLDIPDETEVHDSWRLCPLSSLCVSVCVCVCVCVCVHCNVSVTASVLANYFTEVTKENCKNTASRETILVDPDTVP